MDQKKATHFLNKPFNKKLLSTYLNELEIQHWVTCIKFGLACRQYSHQYMEIKYEDLCHKPIPTLSKVFEFIDISLNKNCKEWAKKILRLIELTNGKLYQKKI